MKTPALAAAILATSIGCASQGSPTELSSFVHEPRPVASPGRPCPAPNGGVPGVHRFDVAMSHTGTATVTLQWPNGDFSLQLYVTAGACADTTGLWTRFRRRARALAARLPEVAPAGCSSVWRAPRGVVHVLLRDQGTPLPQAPYGALVQTSPWNLVFGAPGLLFDQEYGLLPYASAYILAVTGLWVLCRRGGEHNALAIRVVLLFAALFGTVGAFRIWWGALHPRPGRWPRACWS